MTKRLIEKENTCQLQGHLENKAETIRQRTQAETDDLCGRNLHIKQQMATELAAMGFTKRTVERVLNMQMKEGNRRRKTEREDRQEA